jgi:dephospho-CoA kinase
MKIIAFTGMPFSGKSEAVKIAKEQHIPVIRMGDMIWEETKRQGLEINDLNVGKTANDMRKTHGMNIWAKRTYEKVREIKDADVIVIDGVRNIEEVEFFKENLGKDFVLVAVKVSDDLRHKRALSRGREDDSMDLGLIKERDKREIGWGLAKVIDSADITILNESSIKDFCEKIKEVFEDL